MATLSADGDVVRLALTTREKVFAFRGDLEIRRDQVVGLGIERQPFRLLRGIRAPGTRVLKVIAVGRWRHRQGADLVVIHRGEPAVRVDLDDSAPYRRLLIGAEDPDGVVAALGGS